MTTKKWPSAIHVFFLPTWWKAAEITSDEKKMFLCDIVSTQRHWSYFCLCSLHWNEEVCLCGWCWFNVTVSFFCLALARQSCETAVCSEDVTLSYVTPGGIVFVFSSESYIVPIILHFSICLFPIIQSAWSLASGIDWNVGPFHFNQTDHLTVLTLFQRWQTHCFRVMWSHEGRRSHTQRLLIDYLLICMTCAGSVGSN